MNLYAFFKSEVKPSLGCTEPGAVAYAASVAKKYLKEDFHSIFLRTSLSVYKNGRSVGIPGTIGLRGLELACVLGALAGDAERGLLCLHSISDQSLEDANTFIQDKKIKLDVNHDIVHLWLSVVLEGDTHKVECIIANKHDHIQDIIVDGVSIYSDTLEVQSVNWDEEFSSMKFQDLWDLAMNLDDVLSEEMLAGAKMNLEIIDIVSENSFDCASILAKYSHSQSVQEEIKLACRKVSDLRMSGANIEVMSSAGSGNHGIVAILPVAITAKHLNAKDSRLAKALALSHLVCGYIKSYTGRLSPTCGCAMAAGAGAAAAIAYLYDGTMAQSERAAITLIGTLLGMICDGAKESCGLKVSSAAGEAWIAAVLAIENHAIQNQQGLIDTDIHTLALTLHEVNTQMFQHADDIMVNLMTKSN